MNIVSCRPGADEPAFPAWLASQIFSESQKSELDVTHVTLKQPISKKYEGHPIGWLEIFPIFSGVKIEHLTANTYKNPYTLRPSPLNHPHRSQVNTKNQLLRLATKWMVQVKPLGCESYWGRLLANLLGWPSYFGKNWLFQSLPTLDFLGFGHIFILYNHQILHLEIRNSKIQNKQLEHLTTNIS